MTFTELDPTVVEVDLILDNVSENISKVGLGRMVESVVLELMTLMHRRSSVLIFLAKHDA